MELNNLQQPENDGYFTVIIAGESVRVLKTDKVRETLYKLLKDRGITSYAPFLDGEEIQSSEDLPETFEDCTTLEVQKYTKSGGGCGK
jgi:hypothetical protein